MPTIEIKKELQRLRQDFEKQASQYHDLTLSIHFQIRGQPQEEVLFKHPNHTIALWQSMGNVTPQTDMKEFLDFQPTDFGLTQAEVTAYGVVEGNETDLFRRMAYRAGSLISDSTMHSLSTIVMNNFADPKWPGKPVFASNTNPLAVWLNFTLICVATFQPGRFRAQTLAVDPFTASLSVFDYFLDKIGNRPVKHQNMNTSSLLKKKFKVALSFPGEKRHFVSQVAAGLQERLGDIFYDEYFEAELAQPNLDIILQTIYHKNSDLVVVFICEEYDKKEWCGLEWRAIRDLIKQRKSSTIMPMRFDNVEIPGLFSIDGYINLHGRTPEQAVSIICRRIESREETKS